MPDLLRGLLARKDKIAKMPENAQRAIWGVAFGQGVAPKLREAASRGAHLEDETVAKERFITSMLGKQQKPSPDTVVEPPGLVDKTVAAVGAAGSGIAGGFRNLVSHIPAPEGAPMKPMLMSLLGKSESGYELEKSIAPTAAPIAAGIGHQVPQIMAFEAGAGVVPALAGGVTAGAKAPIALRAMQQMLRTGAGTAAMNMTSPEETSGGKLLAQTIGFSVVDMLARGFLRKTGTSGLPDAASVLQTVRESVEKTSGVVNKEAIDAFSNAFLENVKIENPEAYARIVNGEKDYVVLSYTDMVRLTNKTSAQQAALEDAATQNAKTAKAADAKTAEAAADLKKVLGKAQAKLDRASQALNKKALQKEINAYANATGKVPAEGSKALKSLQSGAKAKDIISQEQASVVQRVAKARDVNDAIAVNEEAPAVRGMIDDLQTLASPQVEAVAKVVDVPTVQPTPKVPKAGSVKAKITAGPKEHAYVKFGVTLDASKMTTPEEVITAKRGAMEQIQVSYNQKIKEITEGVRTNALTKDAAVTMFAELKRDSTQATSSVMKFKTPNIGREARDRLRNRANAAEGNRVVGEQQASKEAMGTSSAGAEMTEQEAVDELDTLVKIGFGSTSRQIVAKNIIAEIEKLGGGPIEKLEALQDAYAKLKKAGK